MKVRLYVEGGPVGVHSDALRAFRAAFKKHLVRLDPRLKDMDVVARGSIHNTIKGYAEGFRQFSPECRVALLVDSDGPVAASSCAEHLKPKLDAAGVPAEARAALFLMVQCMESWFIADVEALRKCFGSKFRGQSLPRHIEVEAVPVGNVLAALQEAIKLTPSAKYHKVRHGTRVLESLNPDQVSARSRHARALHEFLRDAASGHR